MENLRILEVEEKYLGRNIRLKDIPQIELPNYESYVLNEYYVNCEDERLKNFIATVSNYMGHCNFYLLYNNLQPLKIERYRKLKWKKMEPYCGGYYNHHKNIIRCADDKNSDSFEHECFHVFSHYESNQNIHGGFWFYNNDNINIGIGLKESYTRFLTCSHFNIQRLPKYGILSWLIEKIIGKEEMESLYSNADLRGLILNLIQYSNESEVTNLINKLDYLYFLIYKTEQICESTNSVNIKIYEMYKDIQKTLFVMLAKKGTDELYDCLQNGEYVKRSPGIEFNMFREDQITNYKVLSRGFFECKKQQHF